MLTAQAVTLSKGNIVKQDDQGPERVVRWITAGGKKIPIMTPTPSADPQAVLGTGAALEYFHGQLPEDPEEWYPNRDALIQGAVTALSISEEEATASYEQVIMERQELIEAEAETDTARWVERTPEEGGGYWEPTPGAVDETVHIDPTTGQPYGASDAAMVRELAARKEEENRRGKSH